MERDFLLDRWLTWAATIDPDKPMSADSKREFLTLRVQTENEMDDRTPLEADVRER